MDVSVPAEARTLLLVHLLFKEIGDQGPENPFFFLVGSQSSRAFYGA
jgi:hypothetical protein